MSFTSIHRIMQKGINSFGQNSNGIKRHSIGDHSVIFNICFPNGDTFEEDFYMKQPLAQQLTKIINEQRRQGSTFMKKKYYYHALHPVDLLIIDEDHKFIPNDRPPGNWPTIVKCIMQERKPLLYVWSFKFCEKDKVSFPDVAHMTEPKFFNKKPDQINQSEHTLLNLPVVRTSSICETLSSQKIPIQFEDSQSPPKAKPRNRNNPTLIRSTPLLLNNAPPIPPKTKCSSMTCIDEQIGQSRVSEDTFENHLMNGIDPLTPQMQQLGIKRSQNVSKIRPMLPPTGKLLLKAKEFYTDNNFQPTPPQRNSSTRRSKINSFILPTEYDEEFSDFQASTSKFNNRDLNFYNHEKAPKFNTTPSSPMSSCFSPLLPPLSRRVAPSPIPEIPYRIGHTPTQSYKFKRDQSLQSFTLPRLHNNTMYQNDNNIDTTNDFSLVAPAIPPKSKRLVSSNSQLPIAMPRKRKPEEIRQRNLTQNISSHHVPLRPLNSIPSSYPNIGNGLAYPRDNHQHVLHPIPLPQKTRNNMPTAFSNPMIPPRMRSDSPFPIRN